MAKLLDILNNIIYKGDVPKLSPTNNVSEEDKRTNEYIEQLITLTKKLKDVNSNMDQLNIRLKQAKYTAATSKSEDKREIAAEKVNKYKKTIAGKEIDSAQLHGNIGKVLDKLKTDAKLDNKKVQEIAKHISANADDLTLSATKTREAMGLVNTNAKVGFGNILGGVNKFLVEFGLVTAAIDDAIVQMKELNRKMVDFNRKMGQGFMSNNIGMDLYGNSKQSSLSSIAMKNNISEEEFLSSFSGLSKGNALGNTNDFQHQQDNMQKFGVQAAQLSKFYGVQMSSINTITSNLVYNFGAKINDLNGIFERGKETATSAGVAVSDYFEKLKEASDEVGKHYIAGGIKGLENLALYAAKTNQSIGDVMRTQEMFKDFTSQYEIQNRAAALNLQNTAQNIAKIWGKGYTGDVKTSDQMFKGSLAKDVINMGGTDKNNMLNQTGLRVLQQMNLDQGQIQTVQRLIKLQKELGVSMEQYLDVEHQSADIKYKVNKFDSENLTISEKLRTMWGKISEAVIDPIKKVLSPVFDGLLNLASIVVNVVTPVLKVLTYPIAMFGRGLSWIGDKLNWLYYQAIEPWSSKLGSLFSKINPLVDSFGKLAKAVWFMVGAFMTARIALLLASKGGGIVGNIMSGAGNLIGGRAGGWLGNAGRGIGDWATTAGAGGLKGLWSGARAGAGNIAGRVGNFLNVARFNTGAGISMGRNLIGRTGIPAALEGAAGTVVGGSLLKLAKGGLVGAGISAAGNYLGKKAGGKEGDALATTAKYSGIGATIGSIIPGIGTALGAGIGAAVGIGVASWGKIKDVWSDGSKGIFEKIVGTFAAIGDTVKDVFVGLFRGIKNMFTSLWDWMTGKEEKQDDIESNKNALASMKFMDTSKAVQSVIDQRRIGTPNVAEKAQEDRMQKEFKPSIAVHVTNSFDGSTKAAVLSR